MSGNLIKRVFYFLLSFSITISGGITQADDIEIYFNTGSSSSVPVRPNVLLILDSSGSMDATVSGTGKTRMQLMKEAMVEIISNMQDVSVGLMRFTNDDGGPILFPITNIDLPAATVVSEPDDTRQTYTYKISAGSDDAEQALDTGDVTIGNPVLTLVQTLAGGDGTYSQRVNASNNDADQYNNVTTITDYFWTDAGGNTHDGARFTGVTIPQGATINSAIFTLTRFSGTGGTTTMSGHAVDNSAAFVAGGADISTRTKTTASVLKHFASTGTEQTEVNNIIQEIVNRPGWNAGNALSLITHSSTGQRRFHSFDTSSGNAPLLTVQYTSGGTATDQLIGMRFPTVDIPRGAVITDARLVLTASSTQGTASASQWQIQAQNIGNADTFTTASNNISSRPVTSASIAWNVPNTVVNNAVTSPDLTAIVQEVVDRGDWCGGNSMAFVMQKLVGDSTRFFHSFEGNSSLAPQLQITYDASAGSPGCYRRSQTVQVATGFDDAHEQTNGSVSRTANTLNLSQRHVGMRFQGVNIPQGATILSATMEVVADSNASSGNPTVTIRGENVDNSTQFTASNNNITSRSQTTASINWTPGNFSSNNTYTTPDLKAVIQEIVNRSGWASGNSLTLIVANDNQTRPAKSFERSATESPKLTITYESDVGASAFKTVRERLIELVNDIPMSDWTPIVETLYESTRYWRGERVRFGLTRDGSRFGRISHPGSYCDGEDDCNGADTSGSYSPYGINNPSGCNPLTNPDSSNCVGQQIMGSPRYISPFNSDLTCQANYQILLTDGEANRNEIVTTIQSEYLGGRTCQTTKSDGSGVTTGERCGIDLVEFMAVNDQSAVLANDQHVRTYTVGFNLDSLPGAVQYLRDMADAGKGKFFEASDATDLVNVFNVILNDVKSDPTSFVSPSLATNAFNRLLSRDEIYFGLFTPSFERSWPGNVKKYKICVDTSDKDNDGQPDCKLGEILDLNNDGAIDDINNKFKDNSTSYWTNVLVAPDGKETVKGGAGGTLTDYTNRIIYTEATSSGIAPATGTSLAFTVNPGHQVTVSNWNHANNAHIRNRVCPVPSATAGSECDNIMKWMLGKIYTPDADSDTSTSTRWTVTDVLHSSPSVVTYGGADTDNNGIIDSFYDKVIVGTNEGGLRFINGVTGEEEWVFIPQEMLDQQRSHLFNAEGSHLYGLDLTPTLRVRDVNGDGFIDPAAGDFVHVYIGMRRGGNSLYALDITPAEKLTSNTTTVVPKFLWRISPASTGFPRLASTWSRPVLSRISISTGGSTFGTKEVLIFGGGYDLALDGGFGTAPTGGANNLGNMIYIVDPDTGGLIMSIGGSGSGASVQVADMKYSIPSRITVLDTQGDGLDDRLYFGDTAGQVWRVDLGDDIKLTGPNRAGSTVVGKLANISTAGGSPPVNERRFFEPPAVVQVLDTVYSDAANGEFDYVLIGSGNRPNPLNKVVHERFYAFRDRFTGKMPDNNNDNLADAAYPISGGPITNSDLVDVTSIVLDSANTTHVQSSGWYFDFTSAGREGEKVLSAPTAIAGGIFFTTYVPDVVASLDLCSANIGGGNAYNLNILTTRAVVDWNEDGILDPLADRIKALGGGIPSDVVPVFTGEGVIGIVGIEGGAAQLGTLSGLPRYRTYWYEEN